MRRLRVLVIPEWYPWIEQPTYGVFCRDQAHVVSHAHDVVVLSSRADESLSRRFATTDEREDGLRTLRVRYRPVSIPKLTGLHRLLGVSSALARLARSHRWRPDVIHAHEYLAAPLALWIGRLSRAPTVVSEHASMVALGRLREQHLRIARRVFRQADVISAPSQDLARRLTELAAGTPIVPVPNAVDTSLFRPGPQTPSTPVRLLTVGNLVEIKGHRYLIDALPGLVDSGIDAQLDVVGDGDRRDALRDQAQRRGVEHRVRFHGVLPRTEVAEMMRQAHVFVLPSLWENMPCALIEAMASGLPAVASRVGGVPEIIDDETGAFSEPASVESLRAALTKIVQERDRYQAGVLRERATSRFGHAAVARQWDRVYELALGRV